MRKCSLNVPITRRDRAPTNLGWIYHLIKLCQMPIVEQPPVNNLVFQTQYHNQTLAIIVNLGYLSRLILYEDFDVVRMAFLKARNSFSILVTA